ncbi:MAG: class I SAM-dependent methyltransferase [Leptolinea sp.]|jgi:ubiquinone/menaquinone biosynthesis C-methylase UbiE|nr:class I SAM-dependent methyltransferase [Leptolinea sp.]
MPEHENVYKNQAERYHALVSCEDYQHNLAAAIQEIIPENCTILESGAGTGRVTDILIPRSKKMVSLDLSVPMLRYANSTVPPDQRGFSGYACADHRSLPVVDRSFDWIVSGWSVCYLVSWERDTWKEQVCKALREFTRVLNERGSILLIETLGTGKERPEPPEHLSDYLSFLDDLGFIRRWIRTDYRFPDALTAGELTGFFFGNDMLTHISRDPLPLLPECTGLWKCPVSSLKKYLPG